ncbi:MAG: sulfatase-like hydrolase/transferase [Phycisphaerae bacterium]|nr:sulfatase-like hydrolase/transferase [Phycisphaerae bacterium]
MGNPMAGITPNLDRLAGQGLLIENCHITTPICGPSRESLFTGLHPQSHGRMGHGNMPPIW